MSFKLLFGFLYTVLCLLVGIGGIIFLYLALCFLAGFAGRNRRIGFWGYFLSSVIFTPIVSLSFLFFASPRRA
jgi:hypothetical protein